MTSENSISIAAILWLSTYLLRAQRERGFGPFRLHTVNRLKTDDHLRFVCSFADTQITRIADKPRRVQKTRWTGSNGLKMTYWREVGFPFDMKGLEDMHIHFFKLCFSIFEIILLLDERKLCRN